MSWLRERVARSEPPAGGLQLHKLADPPVSCPCPRCGWHGNVRKVATVDGDWAAPVCERCYQDLHPGIEAVTSYWSVSEASYLRKTPQDRLPFTVVRSRKHLGGRDEMYRPHLSQDYAVWEFTSVLVEEARDGSSYEVDKISEAEARAIIERTRARYLPG